MIDRGTAMGCNVLFLLFVLTAIVALAVKFMEAWS